MGVCGRVSCSTLWGLLCPPSVLGTAGVDGNVPGVPRLAPLWPFCIWGLYFSCFQICIFKLTSPLRQNRRSRFVSLPTAESFVSFSVPLSSTLFSNAQNAVPYRLTPQHRGLPKTPFQVQILSCCGNRLLGTEALATEDE